MTQTNINKEKKLEPKRKLTPVIDESFYRFEKVGDTLEGVFSEQGFSDKWKRPLYTVGDKRFLGKEQLDRVMKKVSIGDCIQVELIDTLTTPNGTMLIFEVRK